MANTGDLRYVRTEGLIRSIFMELASGGTVSSVTVSAICRRAGISRNAFYLHHRSVDELYAGLVGELVDDVRTESVASAQRRATTGVDDAFCEAIIASLDRHEELLRALLPADDGSLAKCLAQGIEDAFAEAALRFGSHGASFEHDLRCSYAAWALVGFVARWIAGTDRPIIESLDGFQELCASVVETSARYLLDGEASNGIQR